MREQLLSDEAYILTGVYLTIVGVLAVSGNLFVLYVLLFGRPNFIYIHKVMMFLVTLSDLLVGTIAYPLTAVSGYNKRWYFNESTCIATGFIVYYLVMCNIYALVCLAITRYIIVCRPEYERHIQGKRIAWWVTGICGYALVWAGAPLVGWSSYGHEPFQTSCTLNWYGESIADVTYSSLCIIFCYCVPAFIFLYCYFNVLRTTLQRTRQIDWRSQGDVMDNIIEHMARNAKLRASRHMTLICLSMVASFLITWTPYAVVTFLNIVKIPVPSSVHVFPTMFAKLSCAINPVIYSALCHNFREAAARALPCKNKIFPTTFPTDVERV